MVTIKRYANRKLYNTKTRSYVTLDDIAQYLQDGDEVQVIDHASGEDITTTTLTQILAQQEKQDLGSIPQVLLQRMVQLSGLTIHTMSESIRAFLDPINYTDNEIERRLQIIKKQNRISEMERKRLVDMLTDPSLHPSLVNTEDDQPVATLQDLQRLIDQIDALEEKLKAIEQDKS
jgi:polyhydroxyalkanoate synthesis repressor PhaR